MCMINRARMRKFRIIDARWIRIWLRIVGCGNIQMLTGIKVILSSLYNQVDTIVLNTHIKTMIERYSGYLTRKKSVRDINREIE